MLNYVLLLFVYGPIWIIKLNDKNKLSKTIRENSWKYLLVSIADVEANYFIVKAYKHTLVTTIQV